MIDAKPFAEAMSDGDEWYVVIDGIKLGSSCANAICHRAARINAAVARERREAAAEALEEAADERAGDAGDDSVCRWLRTRAAAIERGES